MRAFLLVALVCPLSAMAQDQLTPEEFRALTEGRIFYYEENGIRYGQEEYLPGGQVRWSFFGATVTEECIDGKWWADTDKICFAYEDDPGTTHCWQFWLEGEQIAARFVQESTSLEGYTMTETRDPLPCPGPFLGARYETSGDLQ